MKQKLDRLGAVVAHVILVMSIVTFSARMLFHSPPGHWLGIPILLMAFPLGYLLIRAPGLHRPFLYYVQIVVMLGWLIVLFLVDYLFKYNFRETPWMVISFVMLYFAGLGGMIGVAAQAGRRPAISAIALFIIAGVLAFVQRAVTGL
jgi:hypothetical protein